jgi:rhodanese-related sulfurtransferase
MNPILPRELKDLDYQQVTLLDVRTSKENSYGNIPNHQLIPVDEVRDRLDELDKSKEFIIYCAAGLRGYVASNILKAHGFKVRNLLGGYGFYSIWKTQI